LPSARIPSHSTSSEQPALYFDAHVMADTAIAYYLSPAPTGNAHCSKKTHEHMIPKGSTRLRARAVL
jgi:hypothetical protein